MSKWICQKCEWEGNTPEIAHPEYEDGGYTCCPNGCKGDDGEPEAVVLNFNYPENQNQFARALFNNL